MELVSLSISNEQTYEKLFDDYIKNINVFVSSVGGSMFRNGVGSIELHADLYVDSKPITDPELLDAFEVTWEQYNLHGARTDFKKTGHSIKVTAKDVDIRAQFMATVSLKNNISKKIIAKII